MNLRFICKAKEDFSKLKLIINQSKHKAYAVNYEFNSLSFQCRDRKELNSLELALLKIISDNDISGYFEVEA